MTFPPEPTQYQSGPQFYPGQPYQFPPRPYGGTAITAGIFACLGASWAFLIAAYNLMDIGNVDNEILGIIWAQTILMLIQFGTLLPGAILLFLHKKTGIWLVALGCLISIIQGIISTVASWSQDETMHGLWGTSFLSGSFNGILILFAFMIIAMIFIPSVATLILVLVPSTRRWCEQWHPVPPMQLMQPMQEAPPAQGITTQQY